MKARLLRELPDEGQMKDILLLQDNKKYTTNHPPKCGKRFQATGRASGSKEIPSTKVFLLCLFVGNYHITK